MRPRLHEALKVSILLMLLSQFCSNVFAQQQHDIVFTRDLGLTETFVVNAEYFSHNIPLIEAFREASLYLVERFVFTDVFNVSFLAFLMGLSMGDDIGLSFIQLLDGMSFSESVHEFIERFRAVGGTIISQLPLKNFVTLLALLVGCIGLLFIVQGIKARNDR